MKLRNTLRGHCHGRLGDTATGAPSVSVSFCHQTKELGCEGISSAVAALARKAEQPHVCSRRDHGHCWCSAPWSLFLIDMPPSTSPSLFRMVCINMPWCLSVPPLEGTHCLSPHLRAVSLVLFFTGLDPGAIADLGSCFCPQGISAVNTMLWSVFRPLIRGHQGH